MDKKIPGEKMIMLRGKRTQKEVATAIGITLSSYAMYERGERIPRDEVKVKIAEFFGISIESLFFAHIAN